MKPSRRRKIAFALLFAAVLFLAFGVAFPGTEPFYKSESRIVVTEANGNQSFVGPVRQVNSSSPLTGDLVVFGSAALVCGVVGGFLLVRRGA